MQGRGGQGPAHRAGGESGGTPPGGTRPRVDDAFSWFLDQGHADEGRRLAHALVEFWQATSRSAEGRECLGRTPALHATEDVRRVEAPFQAGLLAFWQGEDAAASSVHHQSRAGARHGDPT